MKYYKRLKMKTYFQCQEAQLAQQLAQYSVNGSMNIMLMCH